MKRTTRKIETFEYKCFQCLKQDDKARCYTRSYDLILHTVITHRKFPVDARHNTYYAADGSDLRDATAEEIKKYRLAASHKRRKPESSCEKSESATVMTDLKKTETIRAPKSEGKKSWNTRHERGRMRITGNARKNGRRAEDRRTNRRRAEDPRTNERRVKTQRVKEQRAETLREDETRAIAEAAIVPVPVDNRLNAINKQSGAAQQEWTMTNGIGASWRRLSKEWTREN